MTDGQIGVVLMLIGLGMWLGWWPVLFLVGFVIWINN